MREIILWLLVAVSVPAVLKRPLLGVIIYLCANIVRPEMLFWGGSRGSFVFSTYYALVLMVSFLQGHFRKIRLIWQPEYLLMAWLLGAILLSIAMSQFEVEKAYYFAGELAKSFGICGLLYLLATDLHALDRLQVAMLGCFTFLGLWGIQQQFLGNERLEGLGGSAWGDSNGVASVYVLFLPVALAKAYASKNRRDFWIFLFVAAVMVALIICTKSRAGFIGLLICLLSFGFYSRQTAQVVKIAVVLAVVAAPFVTDSYLERIRTMDVDNTQELEGSARSRLILWQAGWKVFRDHPLLGTGFLTYPEAKMRYEDSFSDLDEDFRKYVFRTESKKVTHNTYIQMLSDCGLTGAIPYFLLIITGIGKGFWARRRLRSGVDGEKTPLLALTGMAAGVTGFAVCVMTIDAVLAGFLYVQLVVMAIIYRSVGAGPKAELVVAEGLEGGDGQVAA